MLFLNPWMLLGLVGVSIPIVIHLVRRQAAKPIDWGAMRFLLDTVALRRRKVEWEDLLLMIARCLLLGLVALALAKPFVPPDSGVPWLFVLPTALVGLAMFGGSFVLWSAKWRWAVGAVGLLLMLLAAGMWWFEDVLNLKRFEASGRRDVALVIDGSASMGIRRDGVSHFDRALEEARRLVKEAPRGTAFSVILGGPAPESLSGEPLTHRADVLELLDGLQPVGGVFQAQDALGAATLTLIEGENASKEVVVFSDAQRHGWRLDNPGTWDSLGEAWDQRPAPPRLILRRFESLAGFRNVAVGEPRLSREPVGTDREVTIRVEVANTGEEALTPGALSLEVDGEAVGEEPVGLLLAGESETLEFRHRFREAGPAVVRAWIAVDDELAADDESLRIVPVRERLSVLLVDGNPSGGFFERAAGYLALALAPGRARGAEGGEYLMAPERIEAGALDPIDLENRDVVVLADVPRLPAPVAARLASRVGAGAGLVVLAGPRVDPAFYNAWAAGGVPLMPMRIGEEVVDAEGVTPAPASFEHEALELFREEGDLGGARLQRWRRLEGGVEGGVAGGSLADGSTFLAARNYGSGRSLLLACALDARAGDLPAKRSFVPLVHECVAWAAGSGAALDVEASWDPVVRLDESRGGLLANYQGERRRRSFQRMDPVIDFAWNGAPVGNFPRDDFLVEWRGQLTPPSGGRFEFFAEVDDRFELELAGREIGSCGVGKHRLGEIELEAGEPVSLRARLEEDTGGAVARLFWKPPGGSEELVPSSVLSPPADSSLAEYVALDPRGLERRAVLSAAGRGSQLTIEGAAVPGLYRVEVGEAGASWLPGWEGGELPVVVRGDERESRLERIGPTDLELIASRVELVRPESVDDVLAVFEGKGFGRGIWRWLALAGFVLFLLESVLARWVSRSRRAAEDVNVAFGQTTAWEGGRR